MKSTLYILQSKRERREVLLWMMWEDHYRRNMMAIIGLYGERDVWGGGARLSRGWTSCANSVEINYFGRLHSFFFFLFRVRLSYCVHSIGIILGFGSLERMLLTQQPAPIKIANSLWIHVYFQYFLIAALGLCAVVVFPIKKEFTIHKTNT